MIFLYWPRALFLSLAKHPIGLGWQKTTVPVKALLEDNCNAANDISVVDVDTQDGEGSHFFHNIKQGTKDFFFDTFVEMGKRVFMFKMGVKFQKNQLNKLKS